MYIPGYCQSDQPVRSCHAVAGIRILQLQSHSGLLSLSARPLQTHVPTVLALAGHHEPDQQQ